MSTKLLISTFVVVIAAGIVGGIAIGLIYGEAIGMNTDAVAEPAETGCLAGSLIFEDPNITYRSQMSEIDKEFESLINAIEWVESKGDQFAIGDNGMAVGAYQIHTIFVDDVNMIIGTEFFLNEDRFNWWYSRIMTGIYLKHYGGTLEEMARKFNGGPDGHTQDYTIEYWEKVKARMESVK